MNGKELLEALSYIDEELLAASEAPRKKPVGYARIALAACLCLLLLGTASLAWPRREDTVTGAAVQAAPGSPPPTWAEIAAEAPREPAGGQADTDSMADNSITEEAAPMRVELMELTQSGFVARVLSVADAPTVNVVLTEDARVCQLTVGLEYYITVASSEADGTLLVSSVEPAEQEE